MTEARISPPRAASGARNLELTGLALAAGAVDAATYLGLGHAFPANMTGNTVLLGVAVARGDGSAGLRSACALTGFCIGVVLGAVLVSDDGPRSAGLGRVLGLETIAMIAVLVGWTTTGPAGAVRYLLLGGAGATMGLQSVAARSVSHGAIATTYITGTLTSSLSGLVRSLRARRTGKAGPSQTGARAGAVWLLYGAGALGGALIEVSWHSLALVPPLAIIALVGAVGCRGGSRTRSNAA